MGFDLIGAHAYTHPVAWACLAPFTFFMSLRAARQRGVAISLITCFVPSGSESLFFARPKKRDEKKRRPVAAKSPRPALRKAVGPTRRPVVAGLSGTSLYRSPLPATLGRGTAPTGQKSGFPRFVCRCANQKDWRFLRYLALRPPSSAGFRRNKRAAV
jgi:hypothetical protein